MAPSKKAYQPCQVMQATENPEWNQSLVVRGALILGGKKTPIFFLGRIFPIQSDQVKKGLGEPPQIGDVRLVQLVGGGPKKLKHWRFFETTHELVLLGVLKLMIIF